MTIEEILGYLQINPDNKDTVLYKMLEQLTQESYEDGYEAAKTANHFNPGCV